MYPPISLMSLAYAAGHDRQGLPCLKNAQGNRRKRITLN